jgi:uncharacterized protein YcbX
VHVAELWRYPVKSMAGERLDSARITELGVEGDRLVQVYDARDRVVSARTHPRLLGHRATLGSDGEPRVDGRPWSDPSVLDDVHDIAGPAAYLSREDDPRLRFDVLPLLVVTDGAIAEFGRDGRRLRPNLVIGGVTGLDERSWPGGRLRIGEVVIELDGLRSRCVMTTFDPDSLAQDHGVLRDLVRRFGGRFALNAAVAHGGVIHEGQEVELARPRAVA